MCLLSLVSWETVLVHISEGINLKVELQCIKYNQQNNDFSKIGQHKVENCGEKIEFEVRYMHVFEIFVTHTTRKYKYSNNSESLYKV